MRLSTASTFDASIANLQKRQSELGVSQTQLTSGKRVNLASDDPTAAARAERALALELRTNANQRAVDASRNAMTLAESALADASELLQQARELLVASGNAAYSDAERRTQAASVREIRKQLFDIANRPDGSGGYLFAGQGSSQQPFIDAPGGVQFQGAAGRVDAGASESLPLTVDGPTAWLRAPTGNGVFETRPVTQAGSAWIDPGRVIDPSALTGHAYSLTFSVVGGVTTYDIVDNTVPTGGPPMPVVGHTGQPYVSGQAISFDGLSFTISGAPEDGDSFAVDPSTPSLNVFDVLDTAATSLETPLQNGGQIAQAVTIALRDVDASIGRLFDQRSLAGEALKRIDGVESRNAGLKLGAQSERSAAEDLDMVEAISRFQNQQTGYDAALKSYSMVQRLSLFQYIGG